MTPWGGEEETTNSTTFDLEQIVANGELIALALTRDQRPITTIAVVS